MYIRRVRFDNKQSVRYTRGRAPSGRIVSLSPSRPLTGDHSLILMQLFYRYQNEFHLQTNTLYIADLFQHPIIAVHSELICRTHSNTPNIDNSPWLLLNLTQGKTGNFLSFLSIFFFL
jgi:hypothetical protein